MRDRIEDVVSELGAIAADVHERFDRLSEAQLNWRPNAKSWSVAQCLEHVVVTHDLYLPILQRLAQGPVKPSFVESYSPLSGMWGRVLIGVMRPQNKKKSKTMPKVNPSASLVDRSILRRFGEHQDRLIEHLRALPSDLDLGKTIITSPLVGLVTYSLDSALTIFVVHGQRHVGQAQRVTEMEGFPSS